MNYSQSACGRAVKNVVWKIGVVGDFTQMWLRVPNAKKNNIRQQPKQMGWLSVSSKDFNLIVEYCLYYVARDWKEFKEWNFKFI